MRGKKENVEIAYLLSWKSVEVIFFVLDYGQKMNPNTKKILRYYTFFDMFYVQICLKNVNALKLSQQQKKQ